MVFTRINTNVSAVNASRNVNNASTRLAKSLERLSSGLRINRAADDAAGLSISEKLRSQVNGLNQAVRNSQDGISLIQTAEGTMTELHAILQRMRVLSVQAANDINTNEDRQAIQKEVAALVDEVDRIAETAEFNTRKLLDGSAGVRVQMFSPAFANATATPDTQAGPLTGGTTVATHHISAVTAATAATTASGAFPATVAAGSSITINNVIFSFAEVTTRGAVIQTINERSNETGVTASMDGANMRLTSTATGSQASFTVTSKSGTFAGATGFGAADSAHSGADAQLTINAAGVDSISSYSADGNRVRVTAGLLKGLEFDVVSDYTFNAANWTQGDPILNVGPNNTMRFQIGANADQTISVGIRAMSALDLTINQLNLTTYAGANDAITRLDTAIAMVSEQRSDLGAVQNRLEHTIQNLSVNMENLVASESRIRDTDIAYETTQFTRNQIMVQAGTSVLAQANMAPSAFLSLLQ